MMISKEMDYDDERIKRVEKCWKELEKRGIDERNNFTEKNSYRFFFGY